MTRPGGVTASAIVAIIGSAFTLLFAGGMVFAAFSDGPQQAPHFRGIALGMATVLAALAGLGFWTAVGLFRLKSWARISILVFAGIMAAMSLLSGIVLAVTPIPAPPELPPSAAAMMRWALVAIYAVPCLIGVWWLLLFNRQATKDAFAGVALPEQPSPRPLSISIIGWLSLVAGIGTLIVALTGMPAFVAGAILQGWSARLLYLFFGAVPTYLGWGLLKLRERARVLTLAWFGLGAVHTAYTILSPGARARMREFEATLQPERVQPAAFDSATFTSVTMLFSLALFGIAAWFLVRNKAAFGRTPTAD